MAIGNPSAPAAAHCGVPALAAGSVNLLRFSAAIVPL